MSDRRIHIRALDRHEDEGAKRKVAGRLIQLSTATLTLEDESDRRTFGYRNQNPDMARVRVGDILQLTLEYRHQAWRVTDLDVMVPCLMTDQEHTRWMKRWLKQSNAKRRALEMRAGLLDSLRRYFARHEFLEMQTPILVDCPGMEPNLFGFETTWHAPNGGDWSRNYHLPTSPEFALKKMLALGYERIYEFSRSFRNSEISAHHQPEFTMLEWYRAYEGYERIMEDVEDMVSRAAQELLGEEKLSFRGSEISLQPPWTRISVKELFADRMGIDLDNAHSGADLARQANANGYNYVKPTESFDDVYFKLFLTEVELKLGWDKPVILYDYPIEMAALSRRKPGQTRYCERFEVYIAGVELANAFGELNNANEQARRFTEFMEESQRERGFHYKPDQEFLDALRFGMPPAAGIALGFDRLVMLFANRTSLDAVVALPHRSPLEEEDDA